MQHFSSDVKVLFKFSQKPTSQTRSSVAQPLSLEDAHVHHLVYSSHLQVNPDDQLMTCKSAHLHQTELMPTHSHVTSHALVSPNPPYNFCKHEQKQLSLCGTCNWSTQYCLNIEWCLSLISCLLLTSRRASRGGAGAWQQWSGKCSFFPAIVIPCENLVLYRWWFSYMFM